MSPRSRRVGASDHARPRGPLDRGLLVLALLVAILSLLVACAAPFDPTGPCTGDGTAAGAYPDLEAQVPRSFRGNAPSQVDSGRACTTDGLGTLKGHGITEIRYAGSTWTTGTQSGLSLAMFQSQSPTPLTRDLLIEFYETGAKAGKDVQSVDTTDYQVDPSTMGRRIDVLNGESFQSVVVWERGGRVETAIVADFIREIQTRAAHDVVVRGAVDAWRTVDHVGG
jgi:hypothetical protein